MGKGVIYLVQWRIEAVVSKPGAKTLHNSYTLIEHFLVYYHTNIECAISWSV